MGLCADCYICCNNNVVSNCCTADGDEFSAAMKNVDNFELCISTVSPCCGACWLRGKYDLDDNDICKSPVSCFNCLTCIFPCLTLPYYRYKVRKQYTVKGSLINDCFQSYVCYPCTLQISTFMIEHPWFIARLKSQTEKPTTNNSMDGVRIGTENIEHVPSSH